MNDLDYQEWVNRAKEVDILEAAQSRGATLKRAGSEWVGPCPVCGGTDRFSVKQSERVFNCRGAIGGDVIAMVQHVEGCEFIGAVESLTGEPPPRGESKPVDPAVAKERREERKQAERERQQVAETEQQKTSERVLKLWEATAPIIGTHAYAYLKARGLTPYPEQLTDLRFLAALPYRGYASADDDRETDLGSFPCMVAAIRDVHGDIIGLHRTYLDLEKPKKLVPPGDRKRNKAKKVFGGAKHGLIRLGPVGRALAVGEGIETTLSFYQLGYGPDDLTIAAAYSLGNISGGSVGTLPHPNKRGTIQDGNPDMGRPGIILPNEVDEVYLLGDGDSDPATTRAHLLTAGRRFRTQGKQVFPCMADEGKDFNDMLLDQHRGAA